MKRIIIFLSFLGLLFIFFSCDTVEEPQNYTYKIGGVWWSDAIDGNLDGYPQYERLNFIVLLKENTSQNVNGRVYYKLKEASGFSFYAFSQDKRIVGNNKKNNFFVSIGSPNKKLQRGIYDFTIEIYQNNQPDIKAKPDSLQLVTLSNRPFESSASDYNLTLKINWTNQVDRNGNGYLRSASLIIDANIDKAVSKNLDAKLYYKKSTENNFQFYYERNNFEITGDTDVDTIMIPVGVTNIELKKDEYDFKVDIFEAGKKDLLAFEDMENPLLSKQKFETEDDDSYYYTISNVWWSDSTDLDNDTYTSSRKIHFDVDVDKNETRALFAKIYLRPSADDSSDYETFYDSTANFSITGTNNNDAYSVWIGKNNTVALDSNKYDFLISVYDALVDSPQVVEASISAFTTNTLSKQKFETASQDSL